MKRILLPLALIILLSPALMSATPTPTPEPTEVTMPEGWAAIAETREIGGRQVALNEKGDAATQIDGEWYQVDAKGCFYTEFYDLEAQKNDPKIMELVKKINSEKSFIEGKLQTPYGRSHGVFMVGAAPGISYKYQENISDAILMDQQLCFNEHSGEWEHVLDYVLPHDEQVMREETRVARAVVGWIRNGKYVSFTYQQEGEQKYGGNLPDLSNFESEKAEIITDAFGLWQPLIDSGEQVAVGLPVAVYAKDNGSITEDDFGAIVQQLTGGISNQAKDMWKDNFDANFVDWATSNNNQLRYLSGKGAIKDLFSINSKRARKYWGEQVATGKMPEIVARTVTKMAK